MQFRILVGQSVTMPAMLLVAAALCRDRTNHSIERSKIESRWEMKSRPMSAKVGRELAELFIPRDRKVGMGL
jgi:hypothetical protein